MVYLRSMEERDKQEGQRNSALLDENKARLIGEIVSEAVAALGEGRAMVSSGYVMIGPVGERGNPTGPTARGVRGVQK
jgi:hypothetical protein